MSLGYGNLLGTVGQSVARGVGQWLAQRGTGSGDLSPGIGSGRLCAAGAGQATGRGTRAANDAQHALGHDSRVREAAGEASKEAAGRQARPPGQPTSRTRANRPAGNTQIAELPGLRRTIETDRRHADPLCRRHSASRAGSDRAHDPQRLVSELPETCRAEGARRFARRDVGQPCVGAFGLTCTTPWATRSRKSSRCSTSICN